MIRFNATIQKFDKQGEKTGWSYIEIPAALAEKLMPGNKKSFRVKGKLDEYPIKAIALLPMGGGDFIMALKAELRKGIGKRQGAILKVQLEVDTKPLKINTTFLDCLADEPAAKKQFEAMPPSHQHYYSKWIESAKTEPTKTKRIAMAVSALAKKMDFGQMLRNAKKEKDELLGR
jgi:Domain of unknown function (DUF1905)/Bacteriocin-protection, YdeI or OmpD-Associated